MKLLAMLLAAAGLSGCVAYGVPYGAPGYYDGGYYGAPYVVEQPVYLYGAGSYRYQPDHRHGGRRHGDRHRDRDRDGVPDRIDRDRDGDGVPNRRDSRPWNPRRQ